MRYNKCTFDFLNTIEDRAPKITKYNNYNFKQNQTTAI